MADASDGPEADEARSETISWVRLATNIQQKFCELFKGRPWEPTDTTLTCLANLEKNIGYALFGPPPQLPGDNPDTISGYNDVQLKKTRKIHPTIVKLIQKKPKIIMFLFFGVKHKQDHITVPVFRIVEGDTPDAKVDHFVDHNGRMYKGWDDLVKNNLFPNSLLCCPKNGLYNETDGKVDIEFIQPAPASSPRKVLDVLNLTTAIATTSVGVATLLLSVPGSVILAATVVGVVSGCYGLGSSVNNLVDRSLHGQTLSLKSTDARNNWLGLVGSTAGIAMGGLDAVHSAFLPGNSNCLRLLSSLTVGCSAVKGLSVINGFATIANKVRSMDKITPLDAYQLTASVLFFGGSIISMESASTVLQKLIQFDTQKLTNVIGTIEKVDGVIKTAIPKGDDIPMQNEPQKTEKNEFREVNKTKLQNLPDVITEEMEGIKIISIDNHLPGNENYHQTTTNTNDDKKINPGEMQSHTTMLKLIKVLSSPSLKIYQIDNTGPPSQNVINDEAVKLLEFSEQLLEKSSLGKSNSTLRAEPDMKGTLQKVKNVLAAIRTLESSKKGTYTLSENTLTSTENEVNGGTVGKNSRPQVTQNEEEKNKIPENDLQNLLELAKSRQAEEEKVYHEGKNKALIHKPKLNHILMMNRFRHRYKLEKSAKHELSIKSKNEKLSSYNVSDENNEKCETLSGTEN